MGEIGIPRREFLYVIQFWEARAILSGYNKRERGMWSAMRWQTYNLMAAFVGTKALAKEGIHKPTDLLPFPWEKDQTPHLTEEEIAKQQAEMKMFEQLLRNSQ